MDVSFKFRSFSFVYWVMLLFLVGDMLDTLYRFVAGYLGGSSFPGVSAVIQPTSIDLFFFIITQIGVIYGIYLLYKLKKVGGYWFLGSQIVYLIYTSFFGPISKIGFYTILLPLLFFMFVYFVLVILVPWFYSEKFR